MQGNLAKNSWNKNNINKINMNKTNPDKNNLLNKIIFITGATRGIGREIALMAAKKGAKVIVTGKTDTPHPKLPGTIHSVVQEIIELGGQALAVKMDIREEANIQSAIQQAIEAFGGIDILVNNASALNLADTQTISLKQYDLIMNINTRGTFACSKACLPFLKKSSHPHILTLSPPLSLAPKWFGSHLAYTLSKFGMSMCTLGMSEEFKKYSIAVNSLWPKTLIATAAIEFNLPSDIYACCRHPRIVAEAAQWILSQQDNHITGNFFIDEDILRRQGITDFSAYALNAAYPVYSDLFLD